MIQKHFALDLHYKVIYFYILDLLTLSKENPDKIDDFYNQLIFLHNFISSNQKPLIFTPSGTARGAGAALIFSAPFSIASNSLKVSFNECQYGYVPDGGSCFYLSRLPGEMGKFLALTGYILDESDLLHLKLIDDINYDVNITVDNISILPKYTPITDIKQDDYVEGFKFTDNSIENTELYKICKDIYDIHRIKNFKIDNMELGKYHNYYAQFYDVVLKKHFISNEKHASDTLSIGYLQNKINHIFRHSNIDSVINELNKEESYFSKYCLDKINKSSKLAMNLTLALLNEAKGKDFSTVVSMEANVGKYLIQNNKDFINIVGKKLYNFKEISKYYEENISDSANYNLSKDEIMNLLYKENNLNIKKYLLMPQKDYAKIFPENSLSFINETVDEYDTNINYKRSLEFLKKLGLDMYNKNANYDSARQALFKVLNTKNNIQNQFSKVSGLESDYKIINQLKKIIDSITQNDFDDQKLKSYILDIHNEYHLEILQKINKNQKDLAEINKRRLFLNIKKNNLLEMIHSKPYKSKKIEELHEKESKNSLLSIEEQQELFSFLKFEELNNKINILEDAILEKAKSQVNLLFNVKYRNLVDSLIDSYRSSIDTLCEKLSFELEGKVNKLNSIKNLSELNNTYEDLCNMKSEIKIFNEYLEKLLDYFTVLSPIENIKSINDVYGYSQIKLLKSSFSKYQRKIEYLLSTIKNLDPSSENYNHIKKDELLSPFFEKLKILCENERNYPNSKNLYKFDNFKEFHFNKDSLANIFDLKKNIMEIYNNDFENQDATLNSTDQNLDNEKNSMLKHLQYKKVIIDKLSNLKKNVDSFIDYSINPREVKLNYIFSSESLSSNMKNDLDNLSKLYKEFDEVNSSDPTRESLSEVSDKMEKIKKIKSILIGSREKRHHLEKHVSNNIHDHINLPKNYEKSDLFKHLTTQRLNTTELLHNANRLLIEDYLVPTEETDKFSIELVREVKEIQKIQLIKLLKLVLIHFKAKSFECYDKNTNRVTMRFSLTELMNSFKNSLLISDSRYHINNLNEPVILKNFTLPLSELNFRLEENANYFVKNYEFSNYGEIRDSENTKSIYLDARKEEILDYFNSPSKVIQNFDISSKIKIESSNLMIKSQDFNELEFFYKNKEQIISSLLDIIPKPNFNDKFSLEKYVFDYYTSNLNSEISRSAEENYNKMISVELIDTLNDLNFKNEQREIENVNESKTISSISNFIENISKTDSNLLNKAFNIVLKNSYKYKTEVEKQIVIAKSGIQHKYKLPEQFVPRNNKWRYSLYDIMDQTWLSRRSSDIAFREKIDEEYEKLSNLNSKLIRKKSAILEKLKKLDDLEAYEDINKKANKQENLQMLRSISNLLNKEILKDINDNRNYHINKIIDIEPDKLGKLLSIKSTINLNKLNEISNIDKEIEELENQAKSIHSKNSKIGFNFKLKEVFDLEQKLNNLVKNESSYTGYLLQLELLCDKFDNYKTSDTIFDLNSEINKENVIKSIVKGKFKEYYTNYKILESKNSEEFMKSLFDKNSEEILKEIKKFFSFFAKIELNKLISKSELNTQSYYSLRDQEIQKTKFKKFNMINDENDRVDIDKEKEKFLLAKAYETRLIHEFKSELKNENDAFVDDFIEFKQNEFRREFLDDMKVYSKKEIVDFGIKHNKSLNINYNQHEEYINQNFSEQEKQVLVLDDTYSSKPNYSAIMNKHLLEERKSAVISMMKEKLNKI